MVNQGHIWWDAHCHLSKLEVFHEIDKWLKQAEAFGVFGYVLGGIDDEDWKRQKQLKSRFQNRFKISIGIHPWEISKTLTGAPLVNNAQGVESLERLKKSFLLEIGSSELGNWDAFGELGLDYGKRFTENERLLQEEVLNWQLEQIECLGKPVIIHSVRAHQKILQCLEAFPRIKKGMVHSFYGSTNDIERFVQRGFFISLGPAVLRTAVDFLKAVQSIPDDRLLIETDCPDQGSTEAGQSLIKIAEKVAVVRGGLGVQATETLLNKCTVNLLNFFQK